MINIMKDDHKKHHSIVSAICLAVVLCLSLSGCAFAKYKEMDDNIKYVDRPSLVFNGTHYIDPSVSQSSLPHGYTYAGDLDKTQANDTGLEGMKYYRAEGHDDLYVYCEAGVRISFDSVDSTKREWSYVRWIPSTKNAINERKITLDDIKFMLQERNTLKIDFLQHCKCQDVGSGSGGHVYAFEIDDILLLYLVSSDSLAKLVRQGKVIADLNFLLVFNKGEDKISIFSDGLQTFIDKYAFNREEDSRIVMNVLSVSDDDHKAVVFVRNDSDMVINFPPFYRIQKQSAAEAWNNLPLIKDTSVSTILYSCGPGEEGRYEFYWPYYEYPAEKAGIYRMVIEYSFGDWSASAETMNNMYYEYEITE